MKTFGKPEARWGGREEIKAAPPGTVHQSPGRDPRYILGTIPSAWQVFGLNQPLDESESEKVGLKLNIQKTKIMASGPISSWQIDGETAETVADFILGGCPNHCMLTTAMKLKDAYSLEEKLWPT